MSYKTNSISFFTKYTVKKCTSFLPVFFGKILTTINLKSIFKIHSRIMAMELWLELCNHDNTNDNQIMLTYIF